MLERSKESSLERGAQPSFVQFFQVKGLYGYRNISFSSEQLSTILIASNGSGKTTLLGTLDAFLRCEFQRLRSLEFSQIECKLRTHEELLVLCKRDLDQVFSAAVSGVMSRYVELIGVPATSMIGFVMRYEAAKDNWTKSELRELEIYRKLLTHCGYSSARTDEVIKSLKSSIVAANPNVGFVIDKLTDAMKGVDMVYLPTHRRLEVLMNETSNKLGEGKSVNKIRPQTESILSTDIQFGLFDVSQRLSSLNQMVDFESNYGYRELSAKIINELLDGTFDRVAGQSKKIPDRQDLELFFSRLTNQRQYSRFGKVEIPDIAGIYSRPNVSQVSDQFLVYYLEKLQIVMEKTKNFEKMVENFVSSCNSYLSMADESASVDNSDDVGELKKLRFERRDFSVVVESNVSGRTIELDALSSGEKQMISLFARLNLYEGEKIILIDEPEISLSLEWQRRIIPDVVMAPTCKQVIAITHSPFIFDNELEPFARAISLTFDRSSRIDPDPMLAGA